MEINLKSADIEPGVEIVYKVKNDEKYFGIVFKISTDDMSISRNVTFWFHDTPQERYAAYNMIYNALVGITEYGDKRHES